MWVGLGAGWGLGGNAPILRKRSVTQFPQLGITSPGRVILSWLRGGQGAGVSKPSVSRVGGDRALWLCCGVSLPLPVCSDARNMARDVQNTFYEIVSEFGNMSQPQAVDYVKKLMTKGRYSLDVWS